MCVWCSKKWEEMGKSKKIVEKSQNYQIAYKLLPEAANALSKFFGMVPANGTDKVELGATMHQMCLAGENADKGVVLAMVKIKMDPKYGCVLGLQVRAFDEALCQLIMDSLS